MAGLSDYRTALGMRDVMAQLVAREVEQNRPRYRYATVVSVNMTTRKAAVLFPGEEVAVEVPFGRIAAPEGPGQIVRVDGLIGDRFISDILTPYQIPAAEAWHTVGAAGEPAFQNGWTNFGSGHANAGFYKDQTGVVHLKGMIVSGGLGATILTLPPGYRPMTEERFVANANDDVCEFIVSSAGGVSAVNMSAGWLSMAGVQFLAQADKDDRENEMIHGYALNGFVPQIGPPGMSGRPSIWRREDGMCMLVRGGWHSGTLGASVWRVPEQALPRDDWLWAAFGWTGAKAKERVDLRGGLADLVVYVTNNFRSSGIRWFPEGGGWNGDNWILATLQNSWVPFESTGHQWRPPSYYKDPYGIVHLHGLMKNGSVSAVPAFTLPVGYRPGERTLFVTSANGGICRPDIYPNGEMQISTLGSGSSTAYVSLDNVHFRAEG